MFHESLRRDPLIPTMRNISDMIAVEEVKLRDVVGSAVGSIADSHLDGSQACPKPAFCMPNAGLCRFEIRDSADSKFGPYFVQSKPLSEFQPSKDVQARSYDMYYTRYISTLLSLPHFYS